MTSELTVLTLAALLQAVQLVLMAVPVNLEVGPRQTMSPRDVRDDGQTIADQVSPRTGRLIRALNNHFEALVLFTIAVLVVQLSGQSGGFSAVCAWIYLAARVLYVPAYAFGWAPGRSLIWGSGFLATFAMLISALIG